MKLFKRIKAYKKEEIEGAIFGFGKIRAKDYDKGTMGHLIFFSFNSKELFPKKKVVWFLKKLFIPF